MEQEGYSINNYEFIVSEKLLKSIENRTYESHTGRVMVPSDIIERVRKENLTNVLIDLTSVMLREEIKGFCIEIYNHVKTIKCNRVWIPKTEQTKKG